MKNGQVACIDVNLDNNLTVYLDLQPLSFLQALIMMLRDRVLPSSHVSIEVFAVTSRTPTHTTGTLGQRQQSLPLAAFVESHRSLTPKRALIYPL